MRKDHQKWDGDPFWWSFYARQIPIEISSWGAIVGTERRSKLKDVGKDSVKGGRDLMASTTTISTEATFDRFLENCRCALAEPGS
jgi:hypothetical protein